MASAMCRTAFSTSSRPRLPLRRRLATASAGTATAQGPTVPARLAAQLRQLRQFKVWESPSAAASKQSQPSARGGRQAAPSRQLAPGDGASRPAAAGRRRPGIVWFRGDLRTHDHEALTRAQAECSSLLPVYCFDPRQYGKSPQGYDKTGPYRAQFLVEAVSDLRAALRAAGSELVVRQGRPEEVVAELVRRTGAGAVYCHSEVTFEDRQVEAAVKAAADGAGARLNSFWAGTLCHVEDLPFKLPQLPQNFDQFRLQAEGTAVRAALPAPAELWGLPLGGRLDPGDIPTLSQLGLQPLPAGCGTRDGGTAHGSSRAAATVSSARAAGKQQGVGMDGSTLGGEGEALSQLRRFVAQAAASLAGGSRHSSGGGGGASQTAPASGAAYGSNFASSIAPWLATGCLSPRRMLEDVTRALGEAGSATSAGAGAGAMGTPRAKPQQAQQQQAEQAQHPLTWVRYELLWRDFFRFLSLKYSSMSPRQLGAGAATSAPAAARTPAAQPAMAMV